MKKYLICLFGLITLFFIYKLANYQTNSVSKLTENSANYTTGFPKTIQHSNGESITIRQKPQRIISQTLSTDEILLAICPKERIIALHEISLDPIYSNCVEESKSVPFHIQSNPEKILSLKPDLIFVASYSKAETVNLLSSSGAPIYKLEAFTSISDIKQNIQKMGYAIGEELAAKKLVDQIDYQIENIQKKIPRKTRIMSYSVGGYTAGKTTIFDDCVNKIGAINISAEKGLEGFPTINSETVLEWNPDYIVISSDSSEFNQAKQKLLSDPIIATTRAAQSGNIIVIDSRYFLSTSHHIVKCVQALASAIRN